MAYGTGIENFFGPKPIYGEKTSKEGEFRKTGTQSVRHSFSAKARFLIQTRMNETQHIASTILQGEKEIGAGNEIRTRDPDLGKVVLYQLSYSRFIWSLKQVQEC